MKLLSQIYCRSFQSAFRAALPIMPYREPRLLNKVDDIPKLLKSKNIRSVLLVTDSSIHGLGLTTPLETALESSGITCNIYDKVVPNPTIENIEEACIQYQSSGSGAIIAVGGGSCMDCAKITGARIARPGKSVRKMKGLLHILRRTPLMIAVPTTAGTGSEGTVAAVILDSDTRLKYPINDFCLIPDYALLSPEITVGLPPFITATTGMDALTHAVEAYIGHNSTNQYTRELSEKAVTLIVKYLKRAYENGEDLEARKNMLLASYYAGLSFTRSYVGYVHGIAHSLGGQYGIAHGLANAVILPYFLEEYGSACTKKIAQLARVSGIVPEFTEDSRAASAFLRWIKEMNLSMNIPDKIPEIREEDIPIMAAHAAKESNPLYPVPRLMDENELSAMYYRLMPDKKVNETQMTSDEITDLVNLQRKWFNTNRTLSIRDRKQALINLRYAILKHEKELNDALKKDLNKSQVESYMCEIGVVLSDLTYIIRNFPKWAKAKTVPTPLAHFPSHSFTVQNPYGVVLIMSPWNYPFLLTLGPLVGAIAAGNCCIVKTSPDSPATAAVMKRILSECFPKEWVSLVDGGLPESKALLEENFDYIFYTGGIDVGREVMRKASEHLTPVTLELGGKSPVIVDRSANLDLAAKRVVFGKLLNSGQTCVAPDYLLIDRKVKDQFIQLLEKWIGIMYTTNALTNDGYVRMVNRRHFDRVCALIDPDKVCFGGLSDPETLRIQPTILDNVSPEDPVMQEEIFGPLLPVISYDSIDEALKFINSRPHPLALYLFTQDRKTKRRVIETVRYGGGCINDTIVHIATSHMGFGGVGSSGMGSYHGKKSFETFSHEKSILSKSAHIDIPVRYAPYTDFQGKLLRLFLH